MEGRRRQHGQEQPNSQVNGEVKIAEIDMAAIAKDKPGDPSAYVCPECNGALWEVREGELLRFRCRVGHAYGSESLLASKNDELETALWTALRTLEEKAALHRRLSEHATRRRNVRAAKHFQQSADQVHQQAQSIRNLLLQGEQPPLTGTED